MNDVEKNSNQSISYAAALTITEFIKSSKDATFQGFKRNFDQAINILKTMD